MPNGRWLASAESVWHGRSSRRGWRISSPFWLRYCVDVGFRLS